MSVDYKAMLFSPGYPWLGPRDWVQRLFPPWLDNKNGHLHNPHHRPSYTYDGVSVGLWS